MWAQEKRKPGPAKKGQEKAEGTISRNFRRKAEGGILITHVGSEREKKGFGLEHGE
jgi:hypothetical protein